MWRTREYRYVLIGFVLIGFSLFGIGFTIAQTISKAEKTTDKAEMDCVLIQYTGDASEEGVKISEIWLKEKGCKRSVVYPDGYVPVLIPKEEVNRVRALLGKDRFVRISPDLE